MTSDYACAVIGAGAAGVAAARTLAATGRSVVVIEAGLRVGGRAWTMTLDGMALDLGCGWLHSADRNPWVAEAHAAGLTIERGPIAWGRQYRDLGFSPAEQRAAGASWDALEQRLRRKPPASDRAADALVPGDPWNGHADALSGYLNGADLDRLSVADYLAYEDHATDENWRVREGYGTLVAARLPTVPIHLATPVTAIDGTGGAVAVHTAGGTIRADTAIVTVSTAVLASGGIAFAPRLDDRLHAAAHLPLGLADKLFLALEEGHGLEPETHLIGDPHSARTGSFYIRPLGRPVIEGFFGGGCAEALEHEGLAGAFAFAIDELAALLGSAIRAKLRPLAGSSWRRMAGFGGSYSHALPGHAACRAILARPAGERLFFAGEATHPTDFSTAHGAWHSGVRAAEEALRSLP